MPPKMPPKIRKYESGFEKRKKKKRLEELTQSQVGALDKFIIKEQQIPVEIQNVEVETPVNLNVDVESQNIDVENGEDDNMEDNLNADVGNGEDDNMEDNLNADVGNGEDDNMEDNLNIDVETQNVDTETVEDDTVEQANTFEHSSDIFDPTSWNALDSKMIELLVEKGPRRDCSIVNGPKNTSNRRFTANLYTRVLPNREERDRDWLVYWKKLDRVFCFCCKVFQRGHGKGQLATEGYSDWAHIGERLREHETGMQHVKNYTTWLELRRRLQKNQTIDTTSQSLIQKEKDHWRDVLKRIISIVKYLAKHNLAFRGSNGRLYQESNGNFLGLIEMLAEFDPIVQEHVRRITNDDVHFHYLGPRIQNELILLLASAIKNHIIGKIKEAKYFSVILDCTPDVSHQEQMSLIIRYVDVSSNSVSIEESFLGFLNVNDTTGQRLFDVLQDELKNLDLDLIDVRGQGYDNGSNMKGKHQGVQKKFLDINPRAFYTHYKKISIYQRMLLVTTVLTVGICILY